MKAADNNRPGNIQNAFKAGVWYTVSMLVIKSISIISTPLYTRMMSTEDYGISATFNIWYSLLIIICTLNVGYSTGRAKVDFKDKFDDYIGALQLLCAVITLGLFAAAMIFIEPLSHIAGLSKTVIIWLFAYLFFGSSTMVYQGKYRYRYEYKQNIACTVFIAVGSAAIGLPLVALFQEKYMGKIIGTALPAIFLGLFFWIISLKERYINFKKEYISYALKFSLPLIIHSVSIYILGQSDRLMIKYFCGDSDVGIYSLVYQYAVLINLFTNSINEAWNPWFHDNYAMGNHKLICKKIKPLIILGCYIGIGCVAVAPEAIYVLGGSAYLDGLKVVAPITLGIVINFVYTQYVIIEMHLKKTKYVSIGTVIAAVINIVLNYIFIPKLGYIAAAYTTMISYGALLFIHIFITRALLKVHIYKDRQMLMFIVITAGIFAVLSLLYNNIIIRYALITAVSIAMAYFNRDFIAEKLNKIKHKKA